MSDTELEIFELCERLAELLGEKEAIADLREIYKRHPAMFNDMQEVKEIIEKVVSEPEIVVEAKKNNENYDIFKAAKILNDKKMADVVIKNQQGTNEIFHTNKKRKEEFDRLKKRENLLQVETPTPSTHQLNGLGLIDKNLSGANTLSATNNIIPQKDDKESQIKAIQEATKKTSLKLGLGENSKNNTNIELDKSKDIDLDTKK